MEPDGAAVFPADDGGWVYVSNSENRAPALGGVPWANLQCARREFRRGLHTYTQEVTFSHEYPQAVRRLGRRMFSAQCRHMADSEVGALRFNASGEPVDYYMIAGGTTANCGGGQADLRTPERRA